MPKFQARLEPPRKLYNPDGTFLKKVQCASVWLEHMGDSVFHIVGLDSSEMGGVKEFHNVPNQTTKLLGNLVEHPEAGILYEILDLIGWNFIECNNPDVFVTVSAAPFN
jgi:hypothetical protein